MQSRGGGGRQLRNAGRAAAAAAAAQSQEELAAAAGAAAAAALASGGDQNFFRSANAQELALLLWGFAKLGYRPPEAWLKAIVAAAQRQLPLFAAQNVANFLWALAKMRHTPSAAFVEGLSHAVGPKLRYFSSQNLSVLVWASAMLHLPLPPPLLLQISTAAADRLPSALPQHLAMLLWGLAALGAVQSPQWLARFEAASASLLQADAFSAHELASLGWGMRQMQHRPGLRWALLFNAASSASAATAWESQAGGRRRTGGGSGEGDAGLDAADWPLGGDWELIGDAENMVRNAAGEGDASVGEVHSGRGGGSWEAKGRAGAGKGEGSAGSRASHLGSMLQLLDEGVVFHGADAISGSPQSGAGGGISGSAGVGAPLAVALSSLTGGGDAWWSGLPANGGEWAAGAEAGVSSGPEGSMTTSAGRAGSSAGRGQLGRTRERAGKGSISGLVGGGVSTGGGSDWRAVSGRDGTAAEAS